MLTLQLPNDPCNTLNGHMLSKDYNNAKLQQILNQSKIMKPIQIIDLHVMIVNIYIYNL